MNIEIKNVTPANLLAILALRVAPNQASYIENTAQCLEEAKECSFYQPAGLYADNALVGFAMYGWFPSEGNAGRVWLDRFLIDEKYQGRGLGTIMLSALIDHLQGLYGSPDIYLSLFEDNKGALYLYEKFGFRFNGELDINGEKIMVRSESTSMSNQ
ncbi:GNAT family N-acetyltransferase [Paenibacillus bovis]|uniref:Spermidine acetyltransferase n=1 Tax=Paenibacillus bovis TaxID=1616788 RepID=A0A172ZJE3_9BACL|nr:GNAT family N-acetyltransferase [Paenibacillus bovis]ANF97663.1 spermidine acetyltransferase [Paenibacillus bovis]